MRDVAFGVVDIAHGSTEHVFTKRDPLRGIADVGDGLALFVFTGVRRTLGIELDGALSAFGVSGGDGKDFATEEVDAKLCGVKALDTGRAIGPNAHALLDWSCRIRRPHPTRAGELVIKAVFAAVGQYLPHHPPARA